MRKLKVCRGSWLENQKEKTARLDQGLDGRIILRLFLQSWDGVEWIGFIRFRIRATGRLS
jgi:hypothetical protein